MNKFFYGSPPNLLHLLILLISLIPFKSASASSIVPNFGTGQYYSTFIVDQYKEVGNRPNHMYSLPIILILNIKNEETTFAVGLSQLMDFKTGTTPSKPNRKSIDKNLNIIRFTENKLENGSILVSSQQKSSEKDNRFNWTLTVPITPDALQTSPTKCPLIKLATTNSQGDLHFSLSQRDSPNPPKLDSEQRMPNLTEITLSFSPFDPSSSEKIMNLDRSDILQKLRSIPSYTSNSYFHTFNKTDNWETIEKEILNFPGSIDDQDQDQDPISDPSPNPNLDLGLESDLDSDLDLGLESDSDSNSTEGKEEEEEEEEEKEKEEEKEDLDQQFGDNIIKEIKYDNIIKGIEATPASTDNPVDVNNEDKSKEDDSPIAIKDEIEEEIEKDVKREIVDEIKGEENGELDSVEVEKHVKIEKEEKSNKSKVVMIIIILLVVLVLIIGLIFFLMRRKKKNGVVKVNGEGTLKLDAIENIVRE